MTRPTSHAGFRRAARKVGDKLEQERRDRIERRNTGRHYAQGDLGPYCAAGCGTRLVLGLSSQGIAEHPACGPIL